MVELEHNPKYAETLFAIWNGAKTLTQIAEATNKTKPAIMERLERLGKARYIKPDRKQREGEHFSIKWQVDTIALVDFWCKQYPRLNKEKAIENFDSFFSIFASALPSFVPVTINTCGHYFLMCQDLGKKGSTIFDMPLKSLLFMNKKENIKTMFGNKTKMRI